MGIFSLTELTDLTERYCALFRTHRTPPAYRIHRAFQLKVAVTFCEIGWLNVSVDFCVFCSSVIFCERKIVGYSQWGVLSLTERTEFTEHFGAHFEPIRYWPLPQPLPRREGRNMWGYPYWATYILRKGFFSHRTHRFNRALLRTVPNSQNASGIQISQNVIAKGGCWVMSGRCWWLANVRCKVLWNRLT